MSTQSKPAEWMKHCALEIRREIYERPDFLGQTELTAIISKHAPCQSESKPLPGARPVAVEGEYLVSGVVWRATADALDAQLREARDALKAILFITRGAADENNRVQICKLAQQALAKRAPIPAPSTPPPSRG